MKKIVRIIVIIAYALLFVFETNELVVLGVCAGIMNVGMPLNLKIRIVLFICTGVLGIIYLLMLVVKNKRCAILLFLFFLCAMMSSILSFIICYEPIIDLKGLILEISYEILIPSFALIEYGVVKLRKKK